MSKRKTVNAARVIADIKAGLGDVPIMEKYGLTPDDLVSILERLNTNKGVSSKVTGKKAPVAAVSVPKEPSRRKLPRNHTFFALPIYDAQDQKVQGTVSDITTRGLKISGMNVKKGEQRSMVLRSDLFLGQAPLRFNARCQWTTFEKDEQTQLSGFKITDISDADFSQLMRLINQLTIR